MAVLTRRALLTRRTLLTGSLCALAVPVLGGCASRIAGLPAAATPSGMPPPTGAQRELAELESRFGGRLGVYGWDTGSGARLGHRADERFALCSTFKVLAAAAIVRLRSTRPGLLEQRVHYARGQLVAGSPVTEAHLTDGMTVAELCAAAITHSDNTAANQLLGILGGPSQVTAFARALGDQITRLDRTEPELNVVPPGDPRDTSTPAQMATTLHSLVLGDALDPVGRDLLTGWLVANTTGGARIRAGLPAGWRVGDKTGTGPAGEANDLAVAWPPNRQPLVISVYTAPPDRSARPNDQVIASAAAIVARAFATTS
jgi:beta-lactamase class A